MTPEDQEDGKRQCLHIGGIDSCCFSPIKPLRSKNRVQTSLYSPIKVPSHSNAQFSSILSTRFEDNGWNPEVVNAADEVLRGRNDSDFNRANKDMMELMAIQYASGDDIDEDYLNRIQECRIKRKEAIESAGRGYTPNMAPPITFERVEALSSINIGHYATNACISYATEEEKRNATFASYTNGSLFWLPYILAQVAHAHGKHEVTVQKLMKSILVIDLLCIVFDTITFKRKDWPDNEVSSLTIYPSWHRTLSTLFHLESFVWTRKCSYCIVYKRHRDHSSTDACSHYVGHTSDC